MESNLKSTIGALVIGIGLGAGSMASAQDVASAMRQLIASVDTSRADLDLRSRILTLSMRAEPNTEAKSLGWSGAGWTERAYCPASADDEIAAMIAACNVRETINRPPLLRPQGQSALVLKCQANNGPCEALPVVPSTP